MSVWRSDRNHDFWIFFDFVQRCRFEALPMQDVGACLESCNRLASLTSPQPLLDASLINGLCLNRRHPQIHRYCWTGIDSYSPRTIYFLPTATPPINQYKTPTNREVRPSYFVDSSLSEIHFRSPLNLSQYRIGHDHGRACPPRSPD